MNKEEHLVYWAYVALQHAQMKQHTLANIFRERIDETYETSKYPPKISKASVYKEAKEMLKNATKKA